MYVQKAIKEMVIFKNKDFTLKVTTKIMEENNHFVVISPILNVNGYGENKEDAKNSFE